MTRATPPLHHAFTAFVIALGAVAGLLFAHLHAPLPFLMGPIVGSALLVAFGQRHFPAGYRFPMDFRMLFVGVIGAMIGTLFSPEIVAMLPHMIVSIPALVAYVFAVHALNTLIFRRLAGYDRVTAYYSGAPGGLFISIIFGEEQGADVVAVTLLHFLRIILVVTLVPIGMSIWEGRPVGSSAGVSLATGASDPWSVPLVAAIALAGIWIGNRLKLPAGQLIGPLVIAAGLTVSGLVTLAPPAWVLPAAQVVMGVSLGIRFTGMTGRVLAKGMALSLVSVGAMMSIGISLAALVHLVSGLPADTLVVSFAPGGVVEMSLIGLSLSASPAFVTMHHLVRIFVTVGELSAMHRARWLHGGRTAPGAGE